VAGLEGNQSSTGVLTSAVEWIAGLLLGPLSTALAVLAVALLGFIMLSGRLPVRRGASAIIGCFILFSAGAIASGLLAATSRVGDGGRVAAAASEPAYTPSVAKREAYDPFSGAAVPDQSGGDILN
jgi:type IV secretory pathway VirB2 component (pilin)